MAPEEGRAHMVRSHSKPTAPPPTDTYGRTPEENEAKRQENIARRTEESRRDAKAIRAIVTREFLASQDAGGCNLDVHHALVLCYFLRADRFPEAVHAHTVLLQDIRNDLRDYGTADPTYIEIANALYSYIEGPFRFRDGKWIPYLEDAALDGFGPEHFPWFPPVSLDD
jgi:hypothetical protein